MEIIFMTFEVIFFLFLTGCALIALSTLGVTLVYKFQNKYWMELRKARYFFRGLYREVSHAR